MSLSLNVIAKNGGKTLERALKSCEGLYDELIVVDTGSTDNTVEIAEKFGAKVLRFEWEDHFAKARNVALNASTCDWVMYIDCDEWLSEDARKLLPFMLNGEKRCYSSVIRQETGQEHWGQTRLFPREGAEWRFRVHEQVFVNGNGNCVLDPRLVVLHDGPVNETSKAGWYLELAKKDMAEMPDELHCKKQVGLMMAALRCPPDETIPVLEEVIAQYHMERHDGEFGTLREVYNCLLGQYRVKSYNLLLEAFKTGHGSWMLVKWYCELMFGIHQPKAILEMLDQAKDMAWDATGDRAQVQRRIEMLAQWSLWEQEDMENGNVGSDISNAVELDGEHGDGNHSRCCR